MTFNMFPFPGSNALWDYSGPQSETFLDMCNIKCILKVIDTLVFERRTGKFLVVNGRLMTTFWTRCRGYSLNGVDRMVVYTSI